MESGGFAVARQPMLKFVTVGRDMPEKRAAEARNRDFHEIYAEFAEAKAREQASRCSQCGVPYCQTHCPLHNNIPDWLRLTAEGRVREAYELSQQTNTFPEICGRICPQDRLCEGNCVIEQAGHGTVTIGAVEKYLTDTAWEEGWVGPIAPAAERAESVGIVGAGPGGLAAADMLRRAGVQVTVYDRHDRAGGLMTYGIPGFKLEKEVVLRRNRQLEEGGVEFVLNCEVGRDIGFDELRARHDAVLIATGVYKSRELQAPGTGAAGIVRAIDYLVASSRKCFGDEVPEYDSGELNAGARPRQHAWQPARGRQRRGGGRGLRLAERAQGLCRRSGALGQGAADAPWPARRHRPPQPRTHRGLRARGTGRAGDQGAGLRARGPAQTVGPG